MKLIKPKQISGEIMTLIDESDEFVVIVSPYVQVKKWTKLKNTLSSLKKKNIPDDDTITSITKYTYPIL